ncbi:hypothetical protein J6590_035390 [Homalodisca vitripennis]|nr:hypothetical protein J6590_035390 [Homalodisca vitripennis]
MDYWTARLVDDIRSIDRERERQEGKGMETSQSAEADLSSDTPRTPHQSPHSRRCDQ